MDLFKDFNKITHQEWMQKIETDLKGKDFNETLVWKSIEGIDVQPFYNKTALIKNTSVKNGALKTSNGWKINEQIIIDTPISANKKALIALKGGANSITFIGEVNNQQEMDVLMQGIMIDLVDINFYNSSPKNTLALINLKQGSISYDFLGELLLSGNWKSNLENDITELSELVSANLPLKTLIVNGANYNNAGATIIQELAFTLSQGVEYLSLLSDKGNSINDLANNISFNFGVGSNYFFEIAKLRAARILWRMVLEAFQAESVEMHIKAETSNWNLTTYDSNVNMLRVTTEAMSAILGGCDNLTITPFNTTYQNSNSFSERIARNVHHLLKEESFLDKVNNPSDGSYYIEQLTDEIATKAWDLFKTVEQKGGFLSCIKNDFIQSQIKDIANKKKEAVQNGEIALLGTNKHPNKEETKASEITKPVINTCTKNTIINPLPLFRASEAIEIERLIQESVTI